MFIHDLKRENYFLKKHLSKSSSLRRPKGTERGKTRFQTFDQNQNSDSLCCIDDAWKTIFRDFKTKNAKTSDQVGSLQRISKAKFGFITGRLSELENDLDDLRNQIGIAKSATGTANPLHNNQQPTELQGYDTETLTNKSKNRSFSLLPLTIIMLLS